ncbi:MAG: hypothetical protein WBF52_14035 [Geitlerinemataceae cyanobacterium]
MASILTLVEGENPETNTEGKVAGIDLGLTDFAIVNDGQQDLRSYAGFLGR